MKISNWIGAFRLRTLFLSLSCIWAGLICAQTQIEISYAVAAFTFLTALFLQILSNLANDYGDSIHGADHSGRKGPSRAVQSGAISREAMKKGMSIFAFLSFVSGCGLLYTSMPVIGSTATFVLLGIGILSIAAAIAYTNGKKPYGYAGLGDLSVFIFFGWVAVLGTQYLQTAEISYSGILLSVAFGCLSVGVLNLNNMRDIESDTSAGKMSIPVRIGLKNAKRYHLLVLLVSGICLVLFGLDQTIPNLSLSLACIVVAVNMILAARAKDYASFDPLLKWLSLSTLLITLLFQLSL